MDRKEKIRLKQIFASAGELCYKRCTFPLFLRVQGARRRITASAFLSLHLATGLFPAQKQDQNGFFYKLSHW